MNTFILAFSAQPSAISQMLEQNFTAKDAKSAKENGFTAENAEIAEKKWVPDLDQPGYLFLCALSDLCGNFFYPLRSLRPLRWKIPISGDFGDAELQCPYEKQTSCSPRAAGVSHRLRPGGLHQPAIHRPERRI